MRRIIPAITGLLILLGLTLAGPPPILAEDRALLIGVGNYQNPMVRPLPGINHDLEMMGEVVSILGYETVKVLHDQTATLARIKSALSGMMDGVSSSDRVLIYFSGHGSQMKDQNGDEKDNVDEFLVPYDAGVRNRTPVNVFVDDEFGQILTRIPSDNVYVFLDACHSGTATKSFSITKGLMDLGSTQPKFFVYEGMPLSNDSFFKDSESSETKWVALSAAQDNQPAISTPQGSVFTYGLWRAIRKASAQGRKLSMEELRKETESFIATTLAKTNRVHTPQLSGNTGLYHQKLAIKPAAEEPPAQGNGLLKKLEDLVARADYKLDVTLNKSSFRVGELLEVTCRVDRPGYLNIVNIGEGEDKATVLFPNRYDQENLIRAGGQVMVPEKDSRFVLRAHPPKRATRIFVFHTEKPINSYLDGHGKAADLFRVLSDKSMRSFRPEAKPQGGGGQTGSFGAAQITTTIE